MQHNEILRLMKNAPSELDRTWLLNWLNFIVEILMFPLLSKVKSVYWKTKYWQLFDLVMRK